MRRSDYSQMSQQYDEEDSNSNSSDSYKPNEYNARKRKTSDASDDKEMKRQKNREAAKRCREKKQKQTEDLQKRNEELERENTDLVREKHKLLEQCREYEEEIKQHKYKGCSMPHFDPPYDIDQFMNPPTPPSPSLSTSPCTSPAPSISPAPPSRNQYDEAVSPPPSAMLQQVGANVRRMEPTGMAVADALANPNPSASTVPVQDPESFIVKVRDQEGKIRTLAISRDMFEKMKHAAPSKVAVSQPVLTKPQMSPSTSTVIAAPMQQVPFIKTEPAEPFAPCQMHNQQVDLTNDLVDSGQKLDSITDVLSVMQGHASMSTLQFEPVNDPEVTAMIKCEPQDYDNQQNNMEASSRVDAIKQKLLDSSSTPQSMTTASQIRAGLDAVHNPEQSESNSMQSVAFMQLMQMDDSSVLFLPGQNQMSAQSSQEQATLHRPAGVRSIASTAPSSKMATLTTNMLGGQGQTFVMSKAPIGTLKNTSQPTTTQIHTAGQGMQNGLKTRGKHPPGIQLRSEAISKQMYVGASSRQPTVSIQTSHPVTSTSQQFIRVDTTQEAKFQKPKSSTWNGSPGTTATQLQGNQTVSGAHPGKQMPTASKTMQQQQQQQQSVQGFTILLDQPSADGVQEYTVTDILETDPVSGVPVSMGQHMTTDLTSSMSGWNMGKNQAVIPESENVLTFSTGQIQAYLQMSSIESLNAATSS
ncbi:hypothetical protein BaRGS_00001989 [Batillaria attramentaria]|uniref:BZIP domain-containing protein n=1 Tax=Batillaria attramentaria TaxID=370345 RepID=A0ABD0M556_9CAEN